MKVFVLKKRGAVFAAALVAAVLVLSLVLGTSGAYAVFLGGTVRKLPVYSVETEEKKISISFDCAWESDYTDKLLEFLDPEGVRATLFMV